MENQHDKLIQQIDSKRPSLSSEKKVNLWSAIASETIAKESVPSPYSWLVVFKKPIMAPVTLALVLMLGTTGLVAASEPTRPGDTLFAVKQATESIRLALASDDTKTRLEAEFAAERLIELSSILEESLVEYRSSNAGTSLSASDEKRVNQSLGITLSYLGQSRLSSSTKDNLYTELASLLEGAPVRIDDEKIKSYKNDARIEIRNENDDKRIEIEDGENKLRIREKDGGLRIEYKDKWKEDEDEKDKDKKDDDSDDKKFEDGRDAGREEWEYRDSRLNIDTYLDFEIENEAEPEDRNEDDDSEREDEDEDSIDDDENNDLDERDDNEDDSSNDEDSSEETRIEVRVENGLAEVRVDGESNDEFTLPYTTKALLITAIALRTGLSEAIINSNLDLEIKD